MPISLLERCEQAVAAASDPDQRAGAHVELSLAQARLGRLDDARRTLNATRGLILAASPCALRVRAAIAEATLCFLTDREDETIDILWRAHADASAHGALQQAARAQCAAELAFCFQYRGRVLEAITLAAEAWRLARDDDHSTRYTALLTVAILHQEAGLIATAMPLYGAALKQARAAQDDIAVSSVLTQTAIVQAVEVCIERAKGREDTEALRQAVVGMRSAIEFSRTSLNKVPHALEH
jgi:tetratricopeptide (TPR) repeat protein